MEVKLPDSGEYATAVVHKITDQSIYTVSTYLPTTLMLFIPTLHPVYSFMFYVVHVESVVYVCQQLESRLS